MFCRVGVPYGFYHSHSSKSLKTGSDEWLIFIVFLLFKFPKLHCFSCGVLRAFLVPSISWDHILSSEIMPPKLRARNSVHPRAADPSLGPCCPSDCVQEGWGTVGREYLCDLACHATGHPWDGIMGHNPVPRLGEAMDWETGSSVCRPPRASCFHCR